MTKYAVNWNQHEDDFTQMFYTQNTRQFWLPEEISLSSDKNTWVELSKEEQDTYKKVLGGLTLLDTEQGGEGMPLIGMHIEGLQRKGVLSFMGMMEQIHAKSYSTIFTTLASEEEIDEVFNWVHNHPQLQAKGKRISEYYQKLFSPKINKYDLYMAMVASVYLESFLFYSGFFYPLFLAGQGKLTASGEIINLIIRDESIHGVYVGLLAQELYAQLTPEEQEQATRERLALLDSLYENELEYTQDLYQQIGLVEEVNKFIRYNANKACMNLGYEPVYPSEPINPIVENGMKTDTKNHDFFSVKGNGYVKATKVEPISDDDFVFDWK
ncbi:class 1b ribonucleoside-diphosphate reductase subunit beta [Niallia circulans]|jgi:ribonucleoside-diphosphate reductase beta chain|uniref:Ribonucleoside-diphosphate reductase subunit beta n=1 Tax=Niallia circulans TaxID=1397 RepID=A0A0J1HQ47_NIACI|nr:class 1b ribonucleoside-diphosphate reductase subunit beta [Niallia circulans]KLV15828.1 ribonucleotide-diphosphate reductase [Niallia circulans]MCM2981693.1 class 1b ribonucleoside-diphosphate reductase subunit beta [Niallia circulans]MED5100202.1 class 1b ribonucleoside-diphosphate reductase subunit beta [Niallia circulans]NRG30913.1 class 1b ribonucleoside-diphosphate reductase subunit beta [Niallia circulans]PAD24014.1 class 1b ribonucleoside-diphosphate reductase subunit beta [Niallia 